MARDAHRWTLFQDPDVQHDPKTTLVSSQQVVDEVEKNFKNYQLIKARVIGATPPLKERVAMKVAGIDFDILG